MKICVIGPAYPFRGGIAHYTTLLSKEMKTKHEVKFLSFKRQYPKWLYPGRSDKDSSKITIEDCDVEAVLDSMNPLSWFSTFKHVKEFDPDIVIIPWWVAFWTPQFWTISRLIRKKLKAKLLFICHNVVEHESSGIKKLCTRMVLTKGTDFIVHSQEDLENLKAIIPNSKVIKSYHPTYEVFNNNVPNKMQAREKLGLSGNVMLFFGFVRPYKGLKYLLDSMAEVVSEVDVTLLVVGEFWKDKEQYIEQIERLGLKDKVKIVDEYVPNEEVGKYFSASDIVVLPYVSATGSGIVQMAYGFNKPVISTKVGSLTEVVIGGKTGYLIEPRNSRALSKAILDFYRDKKEDEFTKNISVEREKFSWKNMRQTIEGLCD
jgi:glycosyltransferase involved in cell wall biosynthesis